MVPSRALRLEATHGEVAFSCGPALDDEAGDRGLGVAHERRDRKSDAKRAEEEEDSLGAHEAGHGLTRASSMNAYEQR